MRVWKDRDRLADFQGQGFPGLLEPGRLPGRHPRHPARLRRLSHGPAPRRHDFWTPRQSNETYLLDLDELLAGDPPTQTSAADLLESPAAHPLEKLCALLGEHEILVPPRRPSRGAPSKRASSVFRPFISAFTQEDDRGPHPEAPGRVPAGNSQAPLVGRRARRSSPSSPASEDAPDALVRARPSGPQKGPRPIPDSPGGQRCLHIVKSIEAPEFSVEAMRTDAPGRRSVRVTHRNLDRLFFRAYPVDLMERIRTSKDYNIFPEWQEAQADRSRSSGRPPPGRPTSRRPPITATTRPTSSSRPGWRRALPRRRLRPRGLRPQAKPDPGAERLVADLVLLKRDGRLERRRRSRSSSRARRAARSPASRSTSTPLTGRKGTTRIESQVYRRPGPRLFRARQEHRAPISSWPRKGSDIAFDPSYLYLYGRREAGETARRPHLHRPEHLPPRPEALLEDPRLQGPAGPRPARAGRERRGLRLARGHQRPARGRGRRRRRTPSARRAASSSSRPRDARSAPGGSGPRRTATPRSASRNTSGRPSRSRSRTRRSRCA